MRQISNHERVLMRLIWANGGSARYLDLAAGVAELGESWSKNTIVTLLSRLVEKGALSVGKEGRRNRYTALISEQEYCDEQAGLFVDKIYAGDAKGLVSALIRQELLSQADYDELRQYWETEAEGL